MNKIVQQLKNRSHFMGLLLLMIFFSNSLLSKSIFYEDSGSGQSVCQAKAFLVEADNILLTTSFDYKTSMLTNDDCCDNGKPVAITLLYNGNNCGSSSTSQSSSKWSCSDLNGGPNKKATVYIKASDNSNGTGKIYFAGTVNLNSTFTASAANAGESKFPSNTYFVIYTAQNGTLLQRVQIHTSCSAPMIIGDKFGSLELKGVTFDNGSTCPATPPVPDEVCPTPVIIPPAGQICKGQPVVFSAVDLGFPCLTYAWNFGTNATPQVAAGLGPHTVVFSNSGSVSVSLSIDNGCDGGGSGGNGSAGSSGSSGSGGSGSNGTSGSNGSGGSGSSGSNGSGSSGSNGSGGSSGGQGVICGGSNGSGSNGSSGSSGSNGSGSTGTSGSNGSGGSGSSGSNGSGGSGSSGSNGSGTNPCGSGNGSNGSSGSSGSNGSGSTGTSGSNGSGGSGSSGSNGSGGSGSSGSNGDGCHCIECRVTKTITIQVDNCTTGNNGKVGDFVWRDNNGNGVQDAGEPGIAGAWVMITKCNGDYVNGMLTDQNGMYMFSNLPGGSYKVRFVSNNATLMASPANVGDDTKDSDAGNDGWTACFTLGDGQTNLTIDAGFKPISTPSCNVNIGITNIVCDGKGTPSTTDDTYTFVLNVTGSGTSSQWSGSFSNAFLGSFGIAPTAYGTPITLGPFPAGQFTSGNTVPPVTVQNGLNIDVSVNDVQNPNCKNNTVVVSPGPCSPGATASIGDFVWNDLDKNGLQGPNEPGVQGVTVRLLRCDGTFVNQTTTNANGIYGFSGLTPNVQYKVEFSNLPAGFQFTNQDAGNDALDSDASPANGMTTCTLLSPGENDVTWDAGIFDATPPASVGNYVWNDTNKNGLQDLTETGVNGITVKLFTCNGVLVNQTSTNANGLYLFSNVTANQSYYVEFSNLPAGFQFTTKDAGNDNIDSDANANGRTDCFPLAPGQNDLTRDAGIFQSTTTGPGKVGDFVWFDANGNGVQDPNEPGIPGVFVFLETCSGNSLGHVITGPNGMYMFNDVPAGSYRVKFAHPGKYNGVNVQFTTQDAGNDDTKDSDPNWLGLTGCFTLGQGESNLTIDAGFKGETPPPVCVINGSVSNVICNDNGTPNNPGDDTYKFTLIVNGSNTGAWGFDISQTGQMMLAYGTPHVVGPFPISAGPLTLSLCDHDVAGCCTTVSVTPPQTCSNGGPACNNVTNGGSIGSDQTNCGAYDPDNIASQSLPTGGSGNIEYLWLKSTLGCPDNVSQAIPGATGASYDPPSISVTTWYVRLAKRAGCTQWVPSNCVKKEVNTDCNTGCPIVITTSNNTITVSGLNPSNTNIQLFNAQWVTSFTCSQWATPCNTPQQVIGNLPTGTYYIKVTTTYGSGQVCSENKYVNVPGTFIVIPGDENGSESAGTTDKIHAENGELANQDEGLIVADRNGGTSNDTVAETFAASLFPNPAKGSVTVLWQQAEAGQEMEITLMNQLGQQVKTIRLEDAAAGNHSIDLTDLREGQYIVFIRLEGKAPVVKKLMVAR